MSFHIEHSSDGRTGGYDSLGEAVIAALRLTHAPVLIISDADAASPGDGQVVAAVLKKGEVLTAAPEPEWWARLKRSSQQKLLAGGRLDAGVVDDLTEAGGAVAATAWDGGPVDEWELTPASDHDWVRFEAARRLIRG